MIQHIYKADPAERAVFHEICSNDGILARQIAANLKLDRSAVNHYLYSSPFMQELCRQDENYRWHGLVKQTRPHTGLGDFCAWAGCVREFLELDEEQWFEELLAGCRRVGRNLNDTRGLYHSFRDCFRVMTELFCVLGSAAGPDWELCFELRINRTRHIRIYADVLVITPDRVFSLEFKMKDRPDSGELLQAVKYSGYLDVLFGPGYDIIPALVLTRAADVYSYEPIPGTDAAVPVCSGDMLFNLFDEYLDFLQK